MVAASSSSEGEGEQQADSCVLGGWSRRVDEYVGREVSGEEGRVADLLEGDSVEGQLRASCEDARQLSFEAQADIECA